MLALIVYMLFGLALAGRFLTGPEMLSVTHSPWEETGESP